MHTTFFAPVEIEGAPHDTVLRLIFSFFFFFYSHFCLRHSYKGEASSCWAWKVDFIFFCEVRVTIKHNAMLKETLFRLKSWVCKNAHGVYTQGNAWGGAGGSSQVASYGLRRSFSCFCPNKSRCSAHTWAPTWLCLIWQVQGALQGRHGGI